ncbi:MAG: four helix bundle protein [Candidatus Sulfotelmatobacter sp.]|jgi:four helix bundle protein
MSHSYKDLIVWQKAVSMVTEVYRATRSFPREETYGLTSQLRRSAVSVASNIAEGQGRISKPEFRQFLGMARGSSVEMETQIVIAGSLGYISHEIADRLAAKSGEVSRLLHGLMQSLQPRVVLEPGTRNRKPETLSSLRC